MCCEIPTIISIFNQVIRAKAKSGTMRWITTVMIRIIFCFLLLFLLGLGALIVHNTQLIDRNSRLGLSMMRGSTHSDCNYGLLTRCFKSISYRRHIGKSKFRSFSDRFLCWTLQSYCCKLSIINVTESVDWTLSNRDWLYTTSSDNNNELLQSRSPTVLSSKSFGLFQQNQYAIASRSFWQYCYHCRSTKFRSWYLYSWHLNLIFQ